MRYVLAVLLGALAGYYLHLAFTACGDRLERRRLSRALDAAARSVAEAAKRLEDAAGR